MLTQLAYNYFVKAWTPKDIKDLRMRFKLSQSKLGELLGVSRNYVYYLEKGVKKASKSLRLLLECIEQKLKEKDEGNVKDKRNL